MRSSTSLQQKQQDSTINAKQDTIKVIDSLLFIKTEEIKSKAAKLDSASNKLNEKNDSLIASQKEINASQRQTILLQNEVYNQVTGGNSIPLLSLLLEGDNNPVKNQHDLMKLELFNNGKYPISNISMSYFQSIEKRPKIFQPSPNNYKNKPPIVHILVGEPNNIVHITNLYLSARESKQVQDIRLDYDTTDLLYVKWSVTISWRNIEYSASFNILQPNNSVHWQINDFTYFYGGKSCDQEELVASLQKKLSQQ